MWGEVLKLKCNAKITDSQNYPWKMPKEELETYKLFFREHARFSSSIGTCQSLRLSSGRHRRLVVRFVIRKCTLVYTRIRISLPGCSHCRVNDPFHSCSLSAHSGCANRKYNGGQNSLHYLNVLSLFLSYIDIHMVLFQCKLWISFCRATHTYLPANREDVSWSKMKELNLARQNRYLDTLFLIIVLLKFDRLKYLWTPWLFSLLLSWINLL